MHVLLQYQSKSYYIIGQEVYYSIGRFYYIIGQLLQYRAFSLHYRAVITVSGVYYIIGWYNRLTSRNSFLDSTEALNTSKQDARTTLWVEGWNALGERSTEWRDRGIIPNEHLASGTDEPWSTWRSLNRLRVQKGRCRAIMKMWKLSHTDVCDCGERQTMSHLMTCGDAPNCTWTDLAFPTLAGVNCAKHWEESI